MLGVTYKTAWFMAHRIREAMKDDTASKTPLGGKGKVVEADELYIGKRENPMPLSRGRKPTYTKGGKSGPAQKRVVIGLVERGGNTRMFHINHATAETCATWLSATCRARAPCTPTKAASTPRWARSSKRTAPCIMPPANTPARKPAR